MHLTANSLQLPRLEKLHQLKMLLGIIICTGCIYKSVSGNYFLNPFEWGWKEHDGKYIPVATDIEFAPAYVLKLICCKCSADSCKPCGTHVCSCRQYGLSCVTTCKNCNGTSCSIVSTFSTDGILYDGDLVGAAAAEDGDIFDEEFIDGEIVDDEYMEYNMPWEVEEEVTCCS
jgi:hypothetical protein